MTSFAVTATASGAGSVNGISVQLLVLTSAVEGGGASAGVSLQGTAAALSAAVTPNFSGSLLAAGIQAYPSDTPAANNALYGTPVADPGDGSFYTAGHYTGTVTAGTPVTVGISGSGEMYSALAVYEIKGSSGSPAQDASTPAFIANTGAKTVTTASFTPPAGAVLAALVASNGNDSGSIAIAVTDTSGLGLTWTQRAIASTGSVGSQAAVFTATIPASGPTISTSSLPGGTVGTAYSQTVSATGGTTPYAWSISAGSLPSPLTINSSTGVISGTPAAAGTSSFTVKCTDAASNIATKPLSIVVAAAPSAFPATPLGLTAELDVNGTWTSVTPYMDHGPVVIGRGHPDESTTVAPSTLEMTLTNTTGEFTSQNPLSALYPWLKPNIPLRVSIPAATSYLRLEADNSDRAFVNENSRLDITGSLEARIELRPSDWGGGVLGCKWDGGGCWLWTLSGAGYMSLGWNDSGAVFHTVTATVPLPMLNAQTALRVTLNASTGAVTFWTAASIDGTYSQLGAVVSATGATSVATSAGSALAVGWSGDVTPGQLLGAVTGFRLYNGIGGTVVADAAFSSQTPGVTTWTDGPGNTWQLAGGAEVSGRDYRGHFEVPEFPQTEPEYDPDTGESEPDVLCAIVGGGLLRRLGQRNTPLQSPMRRAYTQISGFSAPVAYYPMEDLAGASQLASGLGGPPMYFSGPLQPASSTPFAASAALPVINGATLTITVPAYTGGTACVLRFVMSEAAGSIPNNAVIARMRTTGAAAWCDLIYYTGGALGITGFNAAGTQIFSSGPQAFGVDGGLWLVEMDLYTSGSSLGWSVNTMAPGAATQTGSGGTLASSAPGNVTQVIFNPAGAAGLGAVTIGHAAVQAAYTSTQLQAFGSPLNAWLAEPAGTRIARLCSEEGIPFRGRGNLAATTLMGYQSIETLTQLCQECADADRGVWYELRQQLGWGYATRQALYNQPAALTLDHDQDHLSPWTSDPTQDDQALLNDATVSATTGSSARAYAAPGQPVTGGRLNNQKPPAGIGVYDSVPTPSVNTARDSDLQQIASWMIHIGTTDQQRFPGISIDQANTAYPFFAQTTAMDLGDRLVIVNPPPWLGADPVSQLCQGLKETLWAFDYLIEVNGVPETPYEVAAAGTAVAATAGSQLASGVSATATTLSVSVTAGSLWATGAAAFSVMVAGELMTVTNIAGSSSPQSFTVVRSVNGVVKAQVAGTLGAVQVHPRPVAAL